MTRANEASLLADRGQPLHIRLTPAGPAATKMTVNGRAGTARQRPTADPGEAERRLEAMLCLSPNKVTINGREIKTTDWDGTPWCGLIRRQMPGLPATAGPHQPGPASAGAPQNMGLMIGGTLHNGGFHSLQGRMYMTEDPDNTGPWNHAWLCHVLPYVVITTDEFDSLTDEETLDLYRGTVPSKLTESADASARIQMDRADRAGILPKPTMNPVWQMALAWDQSGVPYGEPPHITARATPVTLRQSGIGGENPEPDVFASAAHALYQSRTGPVPVYDRWSNPPEAMKHAKPVTGLRFKTTREIGTGPVKAAETITLTFELEGETLDIDAPLLVRGDNDENIEIVLTPHGDLETAIEVAVRTLYEAYDGIPRDTAEEDLDRLRGKLRERF